MLGVLLMTLKKTKLKIKYNILKETGVDSTVFSDVQFYCTRQLCCTWACVLIKKVSVLLWEIWYLEAELNNLGEAPS